MNQNQPNHTLRATPQDYLRAMVPHRSEEELAFSLGYYGSNMPGVTVIEGDLQPLTQEEAQEIQESNEAKREGQEDQPQGEPEVVTETKKKRGRPKKSTTTETGTE